MKVAPDLLILAHAQIGADHLQRQRLLVAQGRGKAAPSQKRAGHRRVGFTNLAVHIDNEFIEGHVRLLWVSQVPDKPTIRQPAHMLLPSCHRTTSAFEKLHIALTYYFYTKQPCTLKWLR